MICRHQRFTRDAPSLRAGIELGKRVGQKLARDLQQNEAIASLRGPDGKLDMARYRQLLGTQGMTPDPKNVFKDA